MKIVQENPTQLAQEKMITAGEILKAYREKKSLSLAEVSTATKIPLLRLKQIEVNDFGNFDSQVFTRGFIKNYAEYLGLNVGKVLAIYRRSTATVSVGKNKPAVHIEKIKHEPKSLKEQFQKAKEKVTKFELTPTKIATISGILLIAIVAIYISVQFYRFQQPPLLTLSSPEDNKVFDKDSIMIKGVTEIGAAVKINEQVISTNTSGEFSTDLKLNEGQNKIIIKAYKNNNENRAAIIERTETYTKPVALTAQQAVAQQQAVVITKHKVQIEIIDEDTWITLLTDSKQMIAWVVSPGKTDEYEFESKIELTTGKPRSTKFLIDGKETEVTLTSAGTGGKVCNVTDSKVVCE
jgi:cytoskeletal protein RodZ